MNAAAPDVLPSAVVTTKSLGKFLTSGATIPVGWNAVPVASAGSATTNCSITPFPSYRVDVLVPLLAIQTGSPGAKTSPQALTRFLSWVAPAPAASPTRGLTTKVVGGGGVAELTVRDALCVTDCAVPPPP